MAPIDIVQAQAEVASNEERVIVAEAPIKRAQDNLRALILDPPPPTSGRRRSSRATTRRSRSRRSTSTPRCETRSTGGPTCSRRRTAIERSDLNIRYLRNQMLPDVNAQVNYGAIGVGGVQLPVRNPLTGELARSPIRFRAASGRCSATCSAARIRSGPSACRSAIRSAPARRTRTSRARGSQYQQSQTQLKNIELQVATQVRDVGPQRPDQPEARAVGARVARAAGEEARSGRKEAGGRHVDQLLRLPGAARSLAGAHRRRSRRSPTTTSRWSTSKPCSRRRSTAARPS